MSKPAWQHDKQVLLSIHMKIKVVQHARQSDCEIERVWEWEWESVRVSFEHRHENKSCSEHSNIDTFLVPSYCLTFRHFLLGALLISRIERDCYLWLDKNGTSQWQLLGGYRSQRKVTEQFPFTIVTLSYFSLLKSRYYWWNTLALLMILMDNVPDTLSFAFNITCQSK